MKRGVGSNQYGDKPGRSEKESSQEKYDRVMAARASGLAGPPPRPSVTKKLITPEQVAAISEVLTRHGVKFVVIGGAAITICAPGVVGTEDYDAALQRERVNLDRAAAAMEELDAQIRVDDRALDFPRPITAGVFTNYLGGTLTTYTKHGLVDFVFNTGESADAYENVVARSRTRTIEGQDVVVADLDAVVELKTNAARDKDRETIELLQERFGEDLERYQG